MNLGTPGKRGSTIVYKLFCKNENSVRNQECADAWRRSPVGQSPDTTTHVIGLSRIMGFQPSRREPLPGVQGVWEGNKALELVCKAFQLAQDNPPSTIDSGVGS